MIQKEGTHLCANKQCNKKGLKGGRGKGSRKMDALSVSDVDLFVWLTFSHLWASILKCLESWQGKYLLSHFRLEERLSWGKCSCNFHTKNNSLWVEINASFSLDSISTSDWSASTYNFHSTLIKSGLLVTGIIHSGPGSPLLWPVIGSLNNTYFNFPPQSSVTDCIQNKTAVSLGLQLHRLNISFKLSEMSDESCMEFFFLVGRRWRGRLNQQKLLLKEGKMLKIHQA